MDVMVVAGEASGDQHAADLVAALRAADPTLRFFGMGGPKLGGVGVELTHGAEEISVMGIAEVLPKIPRILTVLSELTREAERRRPACAILVDIPDFNLRLAPRLKKMGVRVIYFISPMVWAWRERRTRVLAATVDRLLCILPFEEEFLRARGVDAHYVGSPVLEQVPPQAPPELFRSQLGLPMKGPLLALLPGSRESEVERLLPTMVQAAERLRVAHPGLEVVVPVAPGLSVDRLGRYFSTPPRWVSGKAPEVIGACDGALVASGTATLEAALMGRPFVVIYRVAPLTYWVGRLMVRAPFFSLPNLLAKRRIVPELLQGEATAERIVSELEAVWSGEPREKLLAGLEEVRASLGPPGAASRAAAQVLELVRGQRASR